MRASRKHVKLDEGGRVTAVRYPAKAAQIAEIILAHGAGADQFHPFMVQAAVGLAARGVDTTTFNFPYTEAGRRAPDPAPKLEACFRDVVRAVRGWGKDPERTLFLGGKSMGGRMASHLAAAHVPHLGGLVFLGYPLHPPGKPEQLRSEHLERITAPMLFVQGTRDLFGTPDELAPILAPFGRRAEMLEVEDGSHSFEVPKRAGRSKDDVLCAVLDRVAAFVASRV